MRERMPALVLAGPGRVALRPVERPQAGPGEVLVRVAKAGVCGTDLGAVRTGRPAIAVGTVLGHEFVGRREDDGARVVVNPILSCGTCPTCAAGREQLCATRQVLGVHRPGAFAPMIAVPVVNVVEVGELELDRAALVEPIATALHAVNLAPAPIRSAAVLGAGAIGMCLLHVLRSRGVGSIAMVDTSPERTEIARQCGASSAAVELSGAFDAVFDAVGAESTRDAAIRHCAAGGTIVLVGLHADPLHASAGQLISREIALRGSFAYTRAEFAEAVGLARNVPLTWSTSVPLTDADTAFDALLSGRADPRHIKTFFAIDEQAVA